MYSECDPKSADLDLGFDERIHHVVSYYTACDAQTLARPSKELDLGPFSNLVPSFDVQPQYHQREGSPTNTLYACTFSKCLEKIQEQICPEIARELTAFSTGVLVMPFLSL
jgi:hypothetical protein